jgi:hypothetical protein
MRVCKTVCRVLAVFLLMAAPAVWAQEPLTNKELLEKSGIAQEIRGLSQTMQKGIDEAVHNGSEFDEKFMTAMRESIPVAYQPAEILKFLDEGLEKLLTPAEKTELLAHYNSDLGKHVSELEKVAVHADAAIRDFAARSKPDAERAALYDRMDEAAGLTSTGVAIAMSMSIAMQAGIISAAEGPDKVDLDALKAQEESQRAPLTDATRKEVLATLAYAYRDLSREDLLAYVAVLESPVARKFSRGLGRLLTDALAGHATELGQLIYTNLRSRKTT